jgi:hypothetical protein
MAPAAGLGARVGEPARLRETALALLVFALLCASTGAGFFVRPRLPEHHRVRETTELMHVTIGLLATFAALVLGLLTASVKQAYDGSAHDRQAYSLRLVLLDQSLRDYGPETAAARGQIHSYTAAVIASTWPDEPPPTGVQYPDTSHMPRVGASPVLASLMDRIGVEIARLKPSDSVQQELEAICLNRYHDAANARLSVIEDARNELFEPFYQVLVFWLMIIFGCFGLVAPRNSLSATTIILCAVSLSSVIFVILDLSTPYEGFFSIPSTTMRSALATMLAPGQ